MSLKNWFAQKRKLKAGLDPDGVNQKLTDEDFERIWIQCYNCQERIPRKQVEENLMVCTLCQYHFRIDAQLRIEQLSDSFEELDKNIRPQDPLSFVDTEPYNQKTAKAEKKSGLSEAIVTGIAT